MTDGSSTTWAGVDSHDFVALGLDESSSLHFQPGEKSLLHKAWCVGRYEEAVLRRDAMSYLCSTPKIVTNFVFEYLLTRI